MQEYICTKRVHAGRIDMVVENGCFIGPERGPTEFRRFDPGMTTRYAPQVGDYWVIYEGGYQAISPREAFLTGYVPA